MHRETQDLTSFDFDVSLDEVEDFLVSVGPILFVEETIVSASSPSPSPCPFSLARGECPVGPFLQPLDASVLETMAHEAAQCFQDKLINILPSPGAYRDKPRNRSPILGQPQG